MRDEKPPVDERESRVVAAWPAPFDAVVNPVPTTNLATARQGVQDAQPDHPPSPESTL